MMTEFVLDLASCTTGRVYAARVTQLMRGTHLYKDWTLDTTHFYCPLVTLKWKSDDLFFAWSRKLHDGARGPRLGAQHSVWQPADRRVTAVSKTQHNTLLLHLSGVLCLESVMSDKKCVWSTQHSSTALRSLWNGKAMTYFLLDLASCTARTVCGSQLMRGSQPFRRLYTSHFCCPFLVCCALNLSWVIKCVGVCVCTDSLQAGFPNRFVFCISLVFSTYPNAHAAKISVFFLSTCLFLLPCSQTYMLPLPFSACFPCLAWICVPPSCQIRLLFGCLDLEPNTAVNTVRAKSKHHEVLARSIKKQRCLLCSCECSFPIKNGLNH